MVVLVQEVLPLVDVRGDRQLDFPDEATVVLGVDEDIPGALAEPVLDPDDLELLVDLFELLQGFDDPDDLGLVGVTLATQEVEDLEGDQVD